MPTSLDPALLSSLAGLLLSLLASYLPGFSTWYASLEGAYKRLVMLAALLIISIGVSLNLSSAVPDPWLSILKSFIAALVANQSAYAISPPLNRPRLKADR